MEEISSQTEFSQSLLKSLNPQHLKSLLKVSSMDEIPSIKLDKAIVIVASIEAGGSLLKSRRLLRELLQTLENIELKNIANTYCNKVYDKPFDNALIISKLSEPVLAKILFQVLDSKLAVALQGMGISISPPNVEKAFFSVSTKSLLPHQEAVVAQSLNMIEEKKNFLIQMPTGAGKTTTALMTLIRSGILNDVFSGNGYGFWIAPTNELLDQAKDTFLSLWARYGNR